MTPKASKSSFRYPMHSISHPFAAVNLNQSPVGKSIFPWGQKFSLKNSFEIVDTSDPESKRQGTSIPPNRTVTTGHSPTTFSYTVDISTSEPSLSPPVMWLLCGRGVGLVLGLVKMWFTLWWTSPDRCVVLHPGSSCQCVHPCCI